MATGRVALPQRRAFPLYRLSSIIQRLSEQPSLISMQWYRRRSCMGSFGTEHVSDRLAKVCHGKMGVPQERIVDASARHPVSK